MLTTIIKQPNELLYQHLRDDLAVASIGAVSVAPRGLVANAATLVATRRMIGNLATLAVSGGSDGERYLVTADLVLVDGQVVEAEIDVAVVEAAWALPDGGAPYLTIADFVRSYGYDEVVRMTDGDGAGRIDRDLLIAALTDAQAIVEAELAARYALPLATVPRIVALAIGDLARARLYPRGAPDGVADAAKAATRSIERIGSGAILLGLPSAQVVDQAPTDTPVLFTGGRRQYPDGLADY